MEFWISWRVEIGWGVAERNRKRERVCVRERGEREWVSEREGLDQMDLSGKAKPNYKGRICIPHGTEHGAPPPFRMCTDIKM